MSDTNVIGLSKSDSLKSAGSRLTSAIGPIVPVWRLASIAAEPDVTKYRRRTRSNWLVRRGNNSGHFPLCQGWTNLERKERKRTISGILMLGCSSACQASP